MIFQVGYERIHGVSILRNADYFGFDFLELRPKASRYYFTCQMKEVLATELGKTSSN